MREDFWEFDPTHTLFLATDHRPEIRGTDHAIWRRIKLVPFTVTIPEAKQDTALLEKLKEELPGILAWAVRGHAAWLESGLGEPKEVAEATAGYRAEMDVIEAFIEERCVLGPNVRAKATPLYQAYKAWCEDAGERPEKQTSFGLRLGERGFERKKIRGVIWWAGIGLREDGDPDRGGDSSSEGDSGGSESSIEAKNPPHEESMLKSGLQPSPHHPTIPTGGDGLLPSSEDDPIRKLLAHPPYWLATQLERCREDPGRLLKPTASTAAYELYGSASRWREVMTHLEAHIGGEA